MGSVKVEFMEISFNRSVFIFTELSLGLWVGFSTTSFIQGLRAIA
jgi:hypothetical protein